MVKNYDALVNNITDYRWMFKCYLFFPLCFTLTLQCEGQGSCENGGN